VSVGPEARCEQTLRWASSHGLAQDFSFLFGILFFYFRKVKVLAQRRPEGGTSSNIGFLGYLHLYHASAIASTTHSWIIITKRKRQMIIQAVVGCVAEAGGGDRKQEIL